MTNTNRPTKCQHNAAALCSSCAALLASHERPMYGVQFADGSYLSSPAPARTSHKARAGVIARDAETAAKIAANLGGTAVVVG